MQMVVKVCVNCGKVIEKCKYQQMMRAFKLNEFADLTTREVDVPSTIS